MRRDQPRPSASAGPKTGPKSDVHASARAGKKLPGASTPDAESAKLKFVRISGLPAVAAVFATAPERVERMFFEPGIGGKAGAFCKTLATLRKPYKQVPPDELARIAGTPMHGSIVALVTPKPIPTLDRADAKAGAAAWARAGEPLLVLDGVSNPHNLGAIARTAAFFGIKRLILSDDPAQALPSDAAYRVARGGLEHVDVQLARDLPAILRALSPNYLVVGAALDNGRPLESFVGGGRPLALVMGNEEDGLGRETLAACDAIVTIPGAGAGRMQSLNVAASSAILVHVLLQGRANRG
jgi:RNA methyltransferase, TrmH family